MTRFFCFLFFLITTNLFAQYIPRFDVQGYRGNSNKPENTILSLLSALDSGITTIKIDVLITADNQVVFSDDPAISKQNCQNGKSGIPIYQMRYDEIRSLNCEGADVGIPLLKDVIISVENHIKGYTAYEVDYAIEIKSSKSTDDKFHPAPEKYSEMVFQVIDQYLPMDRIVIQSADFRVLTYWRKKHPEVRLCALISNSKSVTSNLRELGFNPSVYGVNYKFLKQSQVHELHSRKIRVIPWTVNEIGDMKKLKEWGVDGFVTTYPQRASLLGFGLKFATPEKREPAGR